MVRRVIESEAMEAHRHVGAITYLGDGRLQSVYKPVQDFGNADVDDGLISRADDADEQGRILDTTPASVKQHPEGFDR
jgi:hypothetical protein